MRKVLAVTALTAMLSPLASFGAISASANVQTEIMLDSALSGQTQSAPGADMSVNLTPTEGSPSAVDTTGNTNKLVTINLPSSESKAIGWLAEQGKDEAGGNNPYLVYFKPNSTSFVAKSSNGNAEASGYIISLDGTKNQVIFDQTAFADATEESRRVALQNFVDNLAASSLTEQSQQTIIDQMSSGDRDVQRLLIPMVMDSTSADIYSAMKFANPFLPIVRFIIGLIVIGISILLILSTAIDLAFIGLPVARESMQNKEGKGGGIPFVSTDAVSVVKETESSLDSSGGYKNAYVIYFKRRALTYVVLAFCILYLVVGELGGLISWLMGLGGGLM